MTEDNNPQKETREERWRRESRPPNGQRLKLHSLRFAEVVLSDDYDKLEKGLDLLYDEVVHKSSSVQKEQDNYRQYIAGAKNAFYPSGWVNLQGFMSKEYADSLKNPVSGPKRELPHGIETMGILLIQVIASSIVVVVHTEYQEMVSDSLNDLFTQEYSERLENRFGTTWHYPPERVKEEAIRDFFSKLQDEVETFISTYFKGIFLSDTSKGAQARCPSIKLFSLQDIPFASKETLATWINENHRFVETLGYLSVPDFVYQFDNKYLLLNYQIREFHENSNYLSLLVSESVFNAPEVYEMYATPLYAIRYRYDTEFHNMLAIIAHDSLLLRCSHKAISYRNSIPKVDVSITNDLKGQFKLACLAKAAINDDYFSFIKLRKELEYITSPNNEKWLLRDIPEFELLVNPKNHTHYIKEMISGMRSFAENIDKEYSLLRERYTDIFETINTNSNFILNDSNAKYQKIISRLTWAIFILSAVTAAATIVLLVNGS
jgi:hypothetical protein